MVLGFLGKIRRECRASFRRSSSLCSSSFYRIRKLGRCLQSRSHRSYSRHSWGVSGSLCTIPFCRSSFHHTGLSSCIFWQSVTHHRCTRHIVLRENEGSWRWQRPTGQQMPRKALSSFIRRYNLDQQQNYQQFFKFGSCFQLIIIANTQIDDCKRMNYHGVATSGLGEGPACYRLFEDIVEGCAGVAALGAVEVEVAGCDAGAAAGTAGATIGVFFVEVAGGAMLALLSVFAFVLFGAGVTLGVVSFAFSFLAGSVFKFFVLLLVVGFGLDSGLATTLFFPFLLFFDLKTPTIVLFFGVDFFCFTSFVQFLAVILMGEAELLTTVMLHVLFYDPPLQQSVKFAVASSVVADRNFLSFDLVRLLVAIGLLPYFFPPLLIAWEARLSFEDYSLEEVELEFELDLGFLLEAVFDQDFESDFALGAQAFEEADEVEVYDEVEVAGAFQVV